MAKEYIERDAVLKEQRTFTEYDEGGWDAAVRAVPVDAIKSIPAADVVEVVQCKRCKHVMLSSIWAPRCCKHEIPVKEDDFCSFGERRDNDDR